MKTKQTAVKKGVPIIGYTSVIIIIMQVLGELSNVGRAKQTAVKK